MTPDDQPEFFEIDEAGNVSPHEPLRVQSEHADDRYLTIDPAKVNIIDTPPDDYPRCRTCKWWNANAVESIDTPDYHTPCNNPKLGAGNTEPRDGVTTDEWIESGFWTGPDYGCLHHEDKG